MERTKTVGFAEISRIPNNGKQARTAAVSPTPTVLCEKGDTVSIVLKWAYGECDPADKKQEYYFQLEVWDDQNNPVSPKSITCMDHYLKADKDSDILSVTINCPQQNGTYSYKCKLQARYRYGAWERGLKRGETGATLIEYQEVEDHTETTLTVKVLDNVPDIPHLGGDKEYLVAVMSAMPSNTSVTVRPAESELPGDGIPIYAWADTPVTVTLSAKYAYAEEDDFCKNTWSFALKITNSDGTAIKDLAKPKEDNRRITDKAQPFENQRGSGTLKVAFVTPSTTGEYEYKCSCSAKFTSGGWILSWKDTYSDARDITIKVCVEDKNL